MMMPQAGCGTAMLFEAVLCCARILALPEELQLEGEAVAVHVCAV